MRFTSRTALLLALLSALIFIGPLALMLIAFTAVLVAAVVDAFAVRAAPTGTRSVGSFARGVATRLEVGVDPGRASAVEVRQALPPDFRSPSTMSTGVALDTTLTPQRRGTYTLPPVGVRLDGPLGLGRWYHELGEPETLHVYPDLPGAHRIAQGVRQRSIRSVGDRRRGPLGLGTEFESVREYRHDDDVRQINWRATARLARPMSNNLRVEQDLDVWTFVDAGRLSAASFRVGDELMSRLDLFLDATAAVGLVADDLGDRFGFHLFADETLAHAAPRRRGAMHGIEAGFRVEPELVESDYAAAFATATGIRRSFILVFTDVIDTASAMPLAAALPALTRRHHVVVVLLDDPEFVRIRMSGTDVERRVLADVDAAAEDARRQLTGAGAHVVGLGASRFAEQAVRVYLNARSGTAISAAAAGA